MIDRTGRNQMLFCQDRSQLLLDNADPRAVSRPLRGHRVRLRELFLDGDAYKAAARTTEVIRKRIKEYDEERGRPGWAARVRLRLVARCRGKDAARANSASGHTDLSRARLR